MANENDANICASNMIRFILRDNLKHVITTIYGTHVVRALTYSAYKHWNIAYQMNLMELLTHIYSFFLRLSW